MRAPWARYLAVALPLVAVALLAPPGPVRWTAHLLAALSGPAVMLLGVRWHRPAAPGAFYAAAATQVISLASDAVHTWGPTVLGEQVTHVGGGMLYLIAYLLISWAAGQAARSRSGANTRSDLLQAAILIAPVVLLTAVFVVEPAADAWRAAGGGHPPIELTFPLGVVLMLGAFVRLAQAPGRGRRVAALPAVMIGTLLALDVTGLTDVPLLTSHPVPFDHRWLVMYPLAGAAALLPGMRVITAPGTRRRQPAHAAQIAGLVAAMLTGPAVLAWQGARGEPVSGPAGAAFTALITLLAGARMLEMVRLINAQATTDDLTGLPNRRALQAAAAAVLAGSPGPHALLLADLDRFKEVNDSLGHQAGDELLVQVAERLRERLRPTDHLARLGGDEFAILMPETDRASAEAAAAALVAALSDPFELGELAVHTSVSIGIAVHPEHGLDLTGLLRRADMAMYGAKRYGPVRTHDVADDHQADRLHLAEELRAGLAEGQLVVHYQPKVDLRADSVPGVEALVRWQHPVRGLLYPVAFLDRAEEAGLMPALTDVVLARALDQARTWWLAGRRLQVAVNLSASMLLDSDLPSQVARALADRELPAGALRLEITEEVLMSDRARARAVLTDLRRTGIGISVDDFGTGYSSLAYLRDLPIDELKLDRSFVAPMARDERAAALVASIVALAHSLGLSIVAEGVEDEATRAMLARLGCDQAQGYHLSRPVDAERLDTWLAARSGALPRSVGRR